MLDVPPALDDLADDDRARVKAELAPGERLLWAGRPIPKPVRLTKGYVVAAVIALGCGALCVLFIARPSRPRAPFGSPEVDNRVSAAIVTGGLSLLTALLTVAAWNSKASGVRREARRLYALTDRRAILWDPVNNSEAITVTSYHPSQIEALHRVENPDGSGDVIFSGFGLWGTGFLNIPDVRRVEDLVRMNLGHGVGRRKDAMEDVL